MNAGFPIQEFLPQGRAPQSTAFLRTAGMERSCSGVDDQHAVGARDLVFEARHFRRQIAFVVLVVHWQIIDANEDRLEFAGAKPDERLGELAVDGIATI